VTRTLAVGTISLVASALLAIPAAAAAADGMALTPVSRVPFPQRSFIVDLPHRVSIGNLSVRVLENGAPVRNATLTPVGASDLTFGAVLAVDASDSMAGKPFDSAIGAARAFVERRSANAQVALVAFNGSVETVHQLSRDDKSLQSALAHPPALAYGTKIYDGLGRSLGLLERGRVSSGSIVLLSDGADIGSVSKLDAIIARARRDHVRIFTVGLRSTAFKAAPLREIASSTGAAYAEAASASELTGIYGELSGRLANEYLLQYHSNVRPGSAVDVSVDVGAGLGPVKAAYVAPSPSRLKPFHRSVISRFFLSSFSLVLLSLVAAAAAGGLLYALLTRPQSSLVARVGGFVNIGSGVQQVEPGQQKRRQRRRPHANGAQQWLGRLESEFEIGQITISPTIFLAGTIAATILGLILLATIATPLALLALLVPVFARAWVAKQAQAVRSSFADQLPDTLQLLASALRSGHSFIGALSVVVERAPEPIKREFSQVLTDDQLGLPVERALRNVADRMKSRDMRQVGLLGELQRSAGGNSAEVLDTVVATVRERAEVRRLANTLTAQGRMARWILSVMPVLLGLLMLLIQPDLMKPMLTSGGGQVALVFAALLATAGSFWIKHIVEIEV
jgi:tight adherence protein B